MAVGITSPPFSFMVLSRQAHYPVAEKGSRDKLNNVGRDSVKRHCLEIKMTRNLLSVGVRSVEG